MTLVFLSHGEIAHELTQCIGVFSDLDAAVVRCNERVYASENLQGQESMPYDRHWIEEWTLDGDFIRQWDMVGGQPWPQEPVAEVDA
jgi:hypothetical protein